MVKRLALVAARMQEVKARRQEPGSQLRRNALPLPARVTSLMHRTALPRRIALVAAPRIRATRRQQDDR